MGRNTTGQFRAVPGGVETAFYFDVSLTAWEADDRANLPTGAEFGTDPSDLFEGGTAPPRILTIRAVIPCAVICGADGFEEIERFGEAREDWLRRFLKLPNGIPSHDTFNRVLAALDRDKFAECFGKWMTELCEATGLRAIAVDGKAVRSAPADTFSGCPHLVSAWATENGVVPGQVAVEDGRHEIAAVPELLRVLVQPPSTSCASRRWHLS